MFLLLTSLLFLGEVAKARLKVTQLGGREELQFQPGEVSYQNIQQPLPTRQNRCPDVTCADPERSPLDPKDCSPSNCDNSQCKFRGCVHYGAFGPQWMPDPCTICSCHDRQELCTIIDCSADLECYGYPKRVKEGDCCETCDFGVPENECGVVPNGVKSLYTALGDKDCQTDVVVHGCNKQFVLGEDEKIYRCRPVETTQTHTLDQGCRNGVSEVTYADVSSCVKEEVSSWQIPQDLDFSPRKCNSYVEP